MSKIHHDDISIWVDDFNVLTGQFTLIPVINTIQFFKLQGKRTVLSAENLEPIMNVWYAVKAKDRYYIRRYRNYSIDQLYFYRGNLTFFGDDSAVESLRNYIYDKNVTLLLTKSQHEEIDDSLVRLWKSHFVTTGKLRYKDYINLADQSLKYEDYKDNSRGLTGYKTVCNQFETRLRAIWDQAFEKERGK